jgi:shikimate kinase
MCVLMQQSGANLTAHRAPALRAVLSGQSIILVGMMGAGKSSIGKRLAAALELPFYDADIEIERAAGTTIEEIFRLHGEAYFREGEERVIKRILQGGSQVLATGGGAVISPQTRAEIAKNGVSIWLNAPIDLLLQRVSRRDNRPLLKTENPRAVLARLLSQREPLYREANLVFQSRDAPHDVIVEEMLSMIEAYLAAKNPATPQ